VIAVDAHQVDKPERQKAFAYWGIPWLLLNTATTPSAIKSFLLKLLISRR
jgi:hypothetical protein